MSIVAFSCDIYMELWDIVIKFINCNWNNHPQLYICTERYHPEINGIKFINYNNSDTQKWNHNILECIKQINTKLILFMDADQIIEYVNDNKINKIYNYMIDNIDDVGYVKLQDVHLTERKIENSIIVEDNYMDAMCQASIWNKSCLEKLLYMDGIKTNVWQWEDQCKYTSNNNYKLYQAITNNEDLFYYRLSGCMTHGFWKIECLYELLEKYPHMFDNVNFQLNDFVTYKEMSKYIIDKFVNMISLNYNLDINDVKHRCYYYYSDNAFMEHEKVRYGITIENKHLFVYEKIYNN